MAGLAAPLWIALLIGCLGCSSEPPPRHSVLVVSVDSLRVDRLALWNPVGTTDLPATPHLDALATRGTLYRRAWASAPWTAPSMVSLFTGLQPPSHGVFARDDTTPPGLPTLPRLLAERDYRLGNFSFFSTISYFRNLGLGPPQKGLTHDRLPASFASWLGELPAEAPFFAWLHLLEPHLPYGASGYQATRVQMPGSSGLEAAQLQAAVPVGSATFAEGDRQRLLALYDRDVEAFDAALGAILAALEEHGRTTSTLVVFVADHGEELLEYGWIGHASTAKDARMVPEVLRVPLILAGPEVPAGAIRDELVQPLDVFPTLLRLLRLPAPEVLDGHPLPGVAEGWWPRPARSLGFFDSSVGGNLTPQERRGERLQGVTDGRCLLTQALAPDLPAEAVTVTPLADDVRCPPALQGELLAELEAWRVRQASQRLELLAADPGAAPPPPAEVAEFAETLPVLHPADGATLAWPATSGQVRLAWEGAGSTYWIEYRAGSGVLAVDGAFAVDQAGAEEPHVTFGPFPRGFWNDLAGYSPFHFRVLDPDHRRRSPWMEFTVEPVAEEDR